MTVRHKGYRPDYKPRRKTRELFDNVAEILDEYRDFLPLTGRQIFYRLVARYGCDKTATEAARIGEHLVNARRGPGLSLGT